MKRIIFLLLLLWGLNSYSQSTMTIFVEGEKLVYNIKKCYKRGKIIKTKKGLKFKVVVWGSYAPWAKEYSLIVRSIGGKYAANRQLCSLNDNIEINFK